MIGGGDQIYNDAVMLQSQLFREWLNIKNPHHKHEADFSPSMQEQLETFYLERYSMWFSQGLFGMANSQIPMVNMWDDHGTFATRKISFVFQDPFPRINLLDIMVYKEERDCTMNDEWLISFIQTSSTVSAPIRITS